ncbi:MAG: hypothetical protein ACK2T5_06475 [Anaerolineales bacterium]
MNKKRKFKVYPRLFFGLILFSGFLLVIFAGVGKASSTEVNDPLAQETTPLTPDVSWSNFRYIYAAGSALRPRNSGQDWATSGSGGCIYATSLGGEVMNLHLDIPTGSRIDYLRIFFYDTSDSNSQAWVTTYDGASGIDDIAYVTSSGTGGYGTYLSPYVGHIVDNASDAYVLNWRPVVTGSTMMLCGLRVAYRVPLVDLYLPLVIR